MLEKKVVKFTRDGIREEDAATGAGRMLTQSAYAKQIRYPSGQARYGNDMPATPAGPDSIQRAAVRRQAGQKQAVLTQGGVHSKGEESGQSATVPNIARTGGAGRDAPLYSTGSSFSWENGKQPGLRNKEAVSGLLKNVRRRAVARTQQGNSRGKVLKQGARAASELTRKTGETLTNPLKEEFQKDDNAGLEAAGSALRAVKTVAAFAGKIKPSGLKNGKQDRSVRDAAGASAVLAASVAGAVTTAMLFHQLLHSRSMQNAVLQRVQRGRLPVSGLSFLYQALRTPGKSLSSFAGFAFRLLGGKKAVLALAAGLLSSLLVVQVLPAVGAAVAGKAQEDAASGLPGEVTRYYSMASDACRREGIDAFTELALCVMMRESGGQGSDPMQASESVGLPPNGITDPAYSIEVGVRYLAACLRAAGCAEPGDLDGIRLALQGYNFGAGYIPWAKERGGYSLQNAQEYSAQMAARLGWESYGDPGYPDHVLLYYHGGESIAPGSGGGVHGYLWPVPGFTRLSSQWNENRGEYNHGAIDIAGTGIYGAPVLAAQSGTVDVSRYNAIGGWGGGYGNYCMIHHEEGRATLYAHMEKTLVQPGQEVTRGQVIGYVGSTGDSTGPHLHFECRLNGEKYNPMTEFR